MEDIYVAIHPFDTAEEGEIPLEKGETVRVTEKTHDEWWTVEKLHTTERGQIGRVPANHLEKKKNEERTASKATVIKDYAAHEPGELDLSKDDIVDILDQSVPDIEGYWRGSLSGKTGVFPSSHVEIRDSQRPQQSFKLAAFGVKQGGIGSILANSTLGVRKGSTQWSTSQENSVPPTPPRAKPKSDSPQTDAMTTSELGRVFVLVDYKAKGQDEIDLKAGEYVVVTEEREGGWWKGTNERGDAGSFPSGSNFVKKVDHSPQRPPRTRPPTIQTAENTEHVPRPSNGPPPIPVSTRPSSVSVGPQRPITSPPPPARQSTISKSHTPHQRPATSFTPTDTTTPIPPPRVKSQVLPNLPPMAKVPERFTKQTPTPPSRSSVATSRPSSEVSVPEFVNPPPRPSVSVSRLSETAPRTRPPVPGSRPLSQASASTAENIVSPPSSQVTTSPPSGPVSPPPVPKRIMPLPPPTSMERTTSSRSDTFVDHRRDTAADGEAPPPDDSDELVVQLRQLIQSETEKVREELMNLLEIERIERARLEQEVTDLREKLTGYFSANHAS